MVAVVGGDCTDGRGGWGGCTDGRSGLGCMYIGQRKKPVPFVILSWFFFLQIPYHNRKCVNIRKLAIMCQATTLFGLGTLLRNLYSLNMTNFGSTQKN